MNDLNLFTNVIEQRHQGRVGWNCLPFAHDPLGVNDFARQHGPAVHRKLQNVNHLLATIHLHVRACGYKVSTALRFLGRFVIQQTPERADIARLLDVGVINVDRARIVVEHFLPLRMGKLRGQEQCHTGHQGGRRFQSASQIAFRRWAFLCKGVGIHAPYYKVVD